MAQSFEIHIYGNKRIAAKLKNATEEAMVAWGAAMDTVALQMRNEVVKTLTDGPPPQRTGRIYHRRGRIHQASAPGEPPAIDTGALRNSVAWEAKPRQLIARVMAGGRGAPYARYLEYGTRKMAPRPFMVPTVKRMIPVVSEYLRQAWFFTQGRLRQPFTTYTYRPPPRRTSPPPGVPGGDVPFNDSIDF